MFTADTYEEDIPLFKKLGLKTFKSLDYVSDYYLGTVENDDYIIKVFVTAMPSQFWKFHIRNKETHKVTTMSTGSGALSAYWPTAELIGTNMVGFDREGQLEELESNVSFNSPRKFYRICYFDNAGCIKPFETHHFDHQDKNWFETEKEAEKFIAEYFLDGQTPEGMKIDFSLIIIPIYNVRFNHNI